jgi:peptide/nickel transport system substrate-binding protein
MASSYWNQTLRQRLSRRRALAATGAGAAGAVLLAACGGDRDSEDGGTSSLLTKPQDVTSGAKKGGVMLFWRDREVDTSDPHATTRNAPGSISTYSRLVRRKPGYMAPQPVEFIGDLAESWEVSGDRLQLTFKLRPQAKWHNVSPVSGRAVDAQDIAYSWRRVAAVGANRSLLANSVSPSAPIVSIDAVDDRTVVIKTARPAAGLLGLLSGTISGYLWIIPRESDGGYELRRTTIGSGPWMVQEYVPSVHLIFKRHEGWYDAGKLFFDEVREPIVSEYAAQLAQFKAGSIYDFAVRPADVLVTKRDEPRIDLYQIDPPSNGQIAFFGWNPAYGDATPFRDKRMRQAFSMSWDRDLWIDVFYEVEKFRAEGMPIEVAWNSSILSIWPEWWVDPKGKDLGEAAKIYQYNVAEAKKLVSAAGHPNGIEIKAQYVTTGQYGTDFNKRVETLMNFGRAAGLNMNTVGVGFSTDWRPKVADALGDFEGLSFRSGAAGSQIADVGEGAFAYYHYQGGVNYTGFFSEDSSFQKGDPRLNSLLENIRTEFDEKKRISMMHEVQRIMADAQYMLHFPGSASSFTMSWPALRNQEVFTGELPYLNQWLDMTKPPHGSS